MPQNNNTRIVNLIKKLARLAEDEMRQSNQPLLKTSLDSSETTLLGITQGQIQSTLRDLDFYALSSVWYGAEFAREVRGGLEVPFYITEAKKAHTDIHTEATVLIQRLEAARHISISGKWDFRQIYAGAYKLIIPKESIR